MEPETQIPRNTPGGGFVAPDPEVLSGLLDGYEVVELIACGGMGAVYRAELVSLQREVAIKVLPKELSQFEEFKQSFKSEALAMAKLTHPNLLGVYDFGEVAGMLYLVMEFVKGASLFEAEHGEPVKAIEAVRIVAGVAAGLGHAHEHGILHRDIKPANILISQDLEPKLGDFGLAVPTTDVASGMNMGTPGYFAPEVLRDFKAATPASDVYSLGMILHELLTGITPTGNEPPNLELVPGLRGLRRLVLKATAPHPPMRFTDGQAMAKALHGWLEEARKLPPHILTGSQGGGAAPMVAGRKRVAPHPAPERSVSRSAAAAGSSPPAGRLSKELAAIKMLAAGKRSLVRKLFIIAALLVAIVFVVVLRIKRDGRVGGDDPPPVDPPVQPQAPTVPVNLTVAAGDGKVILKWEGNTQSGFDSFIVRRSTTKGGPYTDVPGATPTVSTYADTGLTNGSTYYYVVAAKNKVDEVSPNSNEVSATPEPYETPPESLARLRASLAAGGRYEMPIGTIRRGNSDFFLITTPMGWHQAALFAEQHGGHLAVPENEQDLIWLSENIGSGSVWIGAYRNQSRKWVMIDGASWALETKPAGSGAFAALSDLGLVRGTKPETKLPFFIQWHRDGSNPATLDAMLQRVGDIDQANPLYPPGTRSHEKRHYLIIVRQVDWHEARKIAKSANGRLVVLAEQGEGLFVRNMVNETLPPAAAAWIGLQYQDGKPAWVTGEPGTFWDWAPDSPDGDESIDSVFRLVAGANGGWDNADPDDADAANSFIIEWSKDHLKPPPGRSRLTGSVIGKNCEGSSTH